MSKTLALRGVVQGIIKESCARAYYRTAPEKAAMPYAVFDLSRVNLQDIARDDFEITIDLWDDISNTKRIDQIADDLEDGFNSVNNPTDDILPTFYRSGRNTVPDSNREIQHVQLTIEAHMYVNE